MKTQRHEISPKLTIAVHGLNMLLRLARTFGIKVTVDLVDRDDWTEVVVTMRDDDDGS